MNKTANTSAASVVSKMVPRPRQIVFQIYSRSICDNGASPTATLPLPATADLNWRGASNMRRSTVFLVL